MIVSFTCQARLILSIGLLLGQVIRVASQGTVGASDLPACASQCASTAATAVGCNLSDTACLCSHPSFSDATRSCASSSCGIEDRSSVNGVLNDMCSATPPSTSSASTSASGSSSTQPSQSSASSQGGTRPSNSSPGSTGTAASNAPSSTNSSNATVGTVYSVGSSSSQSSSSTVVVVQTVVLPQTTNFSGAITRLSLDFGVVGLGLVVGQTVMALVGGFLLL